MSLFSHSRILGESGPFLFLIFPSCTQGFEGCDGGDAVRGNDFQVTAGESWSNVGAVIQYGNGFGCTTADTEGIKVSTTCSLSVLLSTLSLRHACVIFCSWTRDESWKIREETTQNKRSWRKSVHNVIISTFSFACQHYKMVIFTRDADENLLQSAPYFASSASFTPQMEWSELQNFVKFHLLRSVLWKQVAKNVQNTAGALDGFHVVLTVLTYVFLKAAIFLIMWLIP